MPKSPFHGKDFSSWKKITLKLIDKHPIKAKEIVDTVLKSWDDIFQSKIGSFNIGKEIFPSPQILSFLLHELVAHYLSLKYPEIYKVGKIKHEKDIHCITDASLSVEIKASSDPRKIYANRSYAQPATAKGQKIKDGYYITINFQKFAANSTDLPKILLIRFGYLEHTDWRPQPAATGQQATLPPGVYLSKLITIYDYSKERGR